MRVLKFGLSGNDVGLWQTFLRGQQCCVTIVEQTNIFDDLTVVATKEFQSAHDLVSDGIVGPMTLSVAKDTGFVADINVDLPSKPDFGPLSFTDRVATFGAFRYMPANSPSDPEAIKIIDDWPQHNIVTIDIPQLISIKANKVSFNRLVATQLQDLFSDWEQSGLIDRILTWGGSWAPRFIRGSKTCLSNHAWGTAFDINVQWNPLGCHPARQGTKGSVIDLVQIANAHGFYWGGHFPDRPDGMHFEVAKLL
jgi:hypothetical protein